MLSLSVRDQVYLCAAPIDFRNQMRGLIKLTQYVIKQNPYNGAYFVFVNRKKTSVKILHYDGIGYWTHQKKLSKGKFKWPNATDDTITMEVHELQVLLMNGDYEKASFQDQWSRVA